MENSETISLRCVFGQRTFDVDGIPVDSTVGETIRAISIADGVDFPLNDATGYKIRSDDQGRLIQDSEIVGDALHDGEQVTIQEDLHAG